MAAHTVTTNLAVPASITGSVDLSAKQGYFVKLSSGLPVLCDTQGERAKGVIVSSSYPGATTFASTPGMRVQMIAGGSISVGSEITPDTAGKGIAASSTEIVFAEALTAAASGAAFAALIVSPYAKA